jgi:small-conductance mechanosensitive channel
MVKVDNFEGRITDIHTRYTVIRAMTGREAIVPNEMLITQRVRTHFRGHQVAMSTVVQVASGPSRPSAAGARRCRCARILADRLSDPAFELCCRRTRVDGRVLDHHIESGQANVRSNVNLAVLRCLGERSVEIPYPQRVVRQA